jgi:hypothetical protein
MPSKGLILVNINTLADGDPQNNFLEARRSRGTRTTCWRARQHITLGGRFAYVSADAGLVVVDLDDPLKPKLAAVVPLRACARRPLQFRYLFALDESGLTTIDVTDPYKPRHVASARVPFADARAPVRGADVRVRRRRQGRPRDRRRRAARGAALYSNSPPTASSTMRAT